MTGEPARGFAGKVALVTGGAGEVGGHIVESLARAGAEVIVNCFHSYDRGRELAARLTAEGLRVRAVRASVAQPVQVERMFAGIERLDVLVNNAASGQFADHAAATEEALDRAFATNVKGALWCARAARPRMPRGGVIVNVSSIGARRAVRDYLPTGVTKAALEALTRYLAVEFAPYGIRVNAASSGLLDNPTGRLFPQAEQLRDAVTAATPMGRLAASEELASLVLLLAGEHASFVTGQILLADGGLSHIHPAAPATAPQNLDSDAIAVVGMGIAVAGARSPDDYWRLLRSGEPQLSDPPPERWRVADFAAVTGTEPDKTYTQMGGFVDTDGPADEDYALGWLRHSVSQALKGVATADGDRFTLSLGYTADGSQHQEESLLRDEVLAHAASLPPSAAARLEELVNARYGDRGDALTHLPHRLARAVVRGLLPDGTRTHLVDTACSSSLYALDLARRELLTGQADVAVCGGANVLTPTLQVMFAKNGGLARDGAVRALSSDAGGVLFSDGAAVLVLKRLGRALADGDTVHGIIGGVGLSADGRGTSIYKPAAAGQQCAITRALAASGLSADEISLVVAHGTGTPRGDAVELSALRQCYAAERPLPVVSNKSLIGHTGWAAGAASVIHLLLALRHAEIPAQPLFRGPPAEPDLAGTGIDIPSEHTPWPSPGTTGRAGAVSGFGFGGTNAHVVIQEFRPGAVPAAPRPEAREMVIVGYSAVLPQDGPGFGADYPPPPLKELILPSANVRRIDRTQLMLVRGVHALPDEVRSFIESRSERGGAIVGHCGPSRTAMLLRALTHADELDGLLDGPLPGLREEVNGLVLPPTEDSYPGCMPNLAAGRLANRFDLRGLNMSVDQGEASLLEAFQVAAHYVGDGTLEVALVCGVNGNSLPAFAALFAGRVVAEGAFLFAVTSREIAEGAGLPVLATVRDVRPASAAPVHRAETLAGAEGGHEIVAFLEGTDAELRLVRGDEATTRELTLTRTPTTAPSRRPTTAPSQKPTTAPSQKPTTAPSQKPTTAPSQKPTTAPSQKPTTQRTDTTQDAVARHVLSLAPSKPARNRPARPFIPPDSLIITNDPDATAPDPRTPLLLVDAEHVTLHQNGTTTPLPLDESLCSALSPAHLRILADLRGPAVSRLHDAMFLAVRACAGRFGPGNSITALLYNAANDPQAGLYTGFVKVLALEFPTSDVLAVVHDEDLPTALADATTETGERHLLPVIYYRDGHRLAVRARQQATASTHPPLTRDSLVVAAGGGRGIGAELLKGMARASAPRIVVLGTSRPDDIPETAKQGRAAYIRARPQGQSPAEASHAYDRLIHATQVRDTLTELTELCGENRVDYHVCDLLDAASVARVIAHILRGTPEVDLLLNLAGINRNHALATKTLEEFRHVRDFKRNIHHNLTQAFAGNRPARWYNVGSYAGFFALPGSADYAATNDYLFHQGPAEHTIGFSLWRDTGLAASALQQAQFDQDGLLTAMSDDEGVRHFMRELAAGDRPRATVLLGPREIRAIERTAPGYRAWCHDAFFAGRITDFRADAITFTRLFDLDRDGYLEHHLVRGFPTLPGAFHIGIAADAARLLYPERFPVAFENLSLDSFLHVHARDRPHQVQVTAGLTAPGRLHVRVTGDVRAPDGRVLVPDRLHASLDVLLATHPPQAPHWTPWPDISGTDLVNPCVAGAPTIELTGLFAGLRNTRTHPRGRRADLQVNAPDIARWFPESTLPIVQLDGLFQLATLQPPGPIDILVPRTAARVELFDLAPTGPLALVEQDNTLLSITSDGTIAARVTDLTATPIARKRPPQIHQPQNKPAAGKERNR